MTKPSFLKNGSGHWEHWVPQEHLSADGHAAWSWSPGARAKRPKWSLRDKIMTVLIVLILPDPRVQDAMGRAGCSTAWSWSKLWDDPMTKVATEAVYW